MKAPQLPYPPLPQSMSASLAAFWTISLQRNHAELAAIEAHRHTKATYTAAQKSEPLAMALARAKRAILDNTEDVAANLQRTGGLLYGWTGTTLTAADLPERGQRCIVEVVA